MKFWNLILNISCTVKMLIFSIEKKIRLVLHLFLKLEPTFKFSLLKYNTQNQTYTF